MADTHANAFRQDVEDSYVKANQAVAALKEASDALVAKLERDNAPAVEVAAPVAAPVEEVEVGAGAQDSFKVDQKPSQKVK